MMDRRFFVTLLGAAAAAVGRPSHADAQMSQASAYAFSFDGLNGTQINLAEHAGRPILVVNTASHCGYTPQYAGLQQLWARYRERGLLVLAVPSNDFGGQEPGGATEIGKTAQGEYHVSSRSRRRRQSKAARRTPSTNGRPSSGQTDYRGGISTNIWSDGTAR
jgi:glutathione peroxidase